MGRRRRPLAITGGLSSSSRRTKHENYDGKDNSLEDHISEVFITDQFKLRTPPTVVVTPPPATRYSLSVGYRPHSRTKQFSDRPTRNTAISKKKQHNNIEIMQRLATRRNALKIDDFEFDFTHQNFSHHLSIPKLSWSGGYVKVPNPKAKRKVKFSSLNVEDFDRTETLTTDDYKWAVVPWTTDERVELTEQFGQLHVTPTTSQNMQNQNTGASNSLVSSFGGLELENSLRNNTSVGLNSCISSFKQFAL
ncbi:hypothetical protein M3Y94_00429800 [Aphelenchoides besseyi]|nr:hypothetical protein M3Y94_00429800 [Aphelenchoides besseyi]KAI6229491.1 hypothetical protein M3Y95_00536500 [Aphelenchoides besseyi]